MQRPLSMTSFGRGEHKHNDISWVVELRSVNHRFLDIKIKMPREYTALEERINKAVTGSISRGHVDVFVMVSSQLQGTAGLEVNLPLARAYYNSLLNLKEEFDLPDQVTLELMAANSDLIQTINKTTDIDEAWDGLKVALDNAIGESYKMRATEGESLKDDLMARLDLFEATVREIETDAPNLLIQKGQALKERVAKLLANIDMDEDRLAQEISIIADKSDITEELVRLNSHMSQFRQFMDLDEPVGRRLDFLLQEFLREINTTASKINNAATTHKTVFLKNEVEKIKEQVQNLE